MKKKLWKWHISLVRVSVFYLKNIQGEVWSITGMERGRGKGRNMYVDLKRCLHWLVICLVSCTQKAGRLWLLLTSRTWTFELVQGTRLMTDFCGFCHWLWLPSAPFTLASSPSGFSREQCWCHLLLPPGPLPGAVHLCPGCSGFWRHDSCHCLLSPQCRQWLCLPR